MTRTRQYLVLASAILAWSVPAPATQTDPVLSISAARVVSSVGGSLIQIEATYPADDMLQQPIPVQVLVRNLLGSGTSYVRFSLGEAAYEGSAPSLADGLDAADVPGLLASGTPLEGARVLYAGATRIELWLPGALVAGLTEIQLFLVYEGEAILSNPVTPVSAP